MDIKNTAIGAKVVIESLICLLENEGIDISSIKFKVGSDSEGYESPEIEFQKLINVTLNELDELKTQVPEGFVLLPRVISDEWMAVYIDSVVTKYCKDYENLPFSVEESELPEIRESHRLPIRNAHKRLIQVIEAQEQSHEK